MEAAVSAKAAKPQPPPASSAEASEGEQQQQEQEQPWEAGVELDAQDSRGLRPIHNAARRDLAVGRCGCVGGD